MRTTYNLPETLGQDLEEFRERTEHFKSGEISPAEYRSFRVPHGVYEQRKEGAFMLRVRLPAGEMLPEQMRAMARVARKYGSGMLHVTTRQDIQIHDVALNGIHPALLELYEAGLSTKGGGGNTVRNITACPDAGVCAQEIFDVSPYAVALTEFLLPDSLSFRLPRKYKIALSGCPADCAGAMVNDLGFIARRRDDELGFTAYVGGGMGSHSRLGDILEESVPAGEIHLVTEAIKRVFDKHGNRKNRRQARLRFLIEQIGMEQFRKLYEAELAQFRKEIPAALQVRSLPRSPGKVEKPADQPGEGFAAWRQRNVYPQKQDRYFLVCIYLFLGDIPANTLEKLTELVEKHEEAELRTTQSQNLVIRWVCEAQLLGLHRKLAALDLADSPPPILRDSVACAGASTCKLGLCLSRGLARAIRDELHRSGTELDGLGDIKLHINGCPNSCGRHPIASIGLVGAARRVEGRLVPHYVVKLGGRVGESQARLAEGKDTIPARKVPAFLVAFLQAFRDSPQYPDFHVFLDAGGRDKAAEIAAKYKHVPPFAQDKNYYYDWDAEEPFSLAGRGPGECSAGVFDLIDVDLESAREAVQQENLLRATELAARALLITKGEEARDSAEALSLFEKHFIEEGLVDGTFRVLVHEARETVLASGSQKAFTPDPNQVAALVEKVGNLYENMDQSLRFPTPAPAEQKQTQKDGPGEIQIDQEADLRGVTCPFNYVKTKLLLDQMGKGQVLSVLLNEEGGKKVPESAEKDGHKVLSVKQEGTQWRVILMKGPGNTN